MARLSIFLISILLFSACSESGGAPSPEQTAAAASGAPAPAAETPAEPMPPDPASALSFRSYDGRDISIEDYKGKVVAVLFFSTDCPHCQHTAEVLAPIYRQYQPKGGEILGMAINPSSATNLPAFVARYRVEFPVGRGTRSQWASFGKFSVMRNAYVPHMMFVGKDGKVAEDHPGEDTEFWMDQEQNIRASFERLLAQ